MHQSLLLGLHNKVLIFDEVHAAGEYMFEHTETGTPICLYDWKHTTLYDHDGIKPADFWKLDEEVQFNIGSTNSMAYGFDKWIKLVIKNRLNEINEGVENEI